MHFDNREYATILAGLRAWQELLTHVDTLTPQQVAILDDIATNCGLYEPLSVNEIDMLIDRMQEEHDDA